MTRRVPHIRVVMPDHVRGAISAARGARFFITLPDQEEVEATWLQGASLHLDIDDVQRVDLRLLGSIEVEYEEAST